MFCLLFTANLRTKILDVRRFDSSRISIVSCGILMPIGDCPETLSQQILVGIILAGRLGVCCFPYQSAMGVLLVCWSVDFMAGLLIMLLSGGGIPGPWGISWKS